MIKVYNDMIVVPKVDPSFLNIKISLERVVPERTVFSKRGKITIPSYTDRAYMSDRNNIYIQVGLFDYLKPFIEEYQDYRTSSSLFNTEQAIVNIDKYTNILPGITLRPEQLIACKKILYKHRCIVQLTTGCFTDDTKVTVYNPKDEENHSMTFLELYNSDYSNLKVYVSDEDSNVKLSNIRSVHITKYVKKLLRLNFSNGTTIRCTMHHPFMLNNGEYKCACDLTTDDHLMGLFINRGQIKSFSDDELVSIEIEELEYHTPVYDLETVDKLHNFAIELFHSNNYNYGVFVHNSGKTEIMCAVTKILQDVNNGVLPTTLIMEPTTRLVDDTIKRFKKYGIEVTKYNDNRRIIDNVVNICHPKSLGNDLEKDPNHLSNVQVLFGDEAHHMQSESFRKPLYRIPNLAYSVGVSASAISQQHVNVKDVRWFDCKELLTIGACGPLVLNVTADSMIAAGNLAKPVLLIVDNPADEPMREIDIPNWHKVMNIKLKSPTRIDLVSRSAKEFADRNMKVLILVTTIEWSRMILSRLKYLGVDAIASYGGGRFEKCNPIVTNEDDEYISLPNDTMEKFASGEYKVLVGTTHLYEGIDIPNLDAIILGYGGRAERMQIQGLGRVLRKTKSGNMAYIVDFTDSQDVVLRKHSNIRMKRYKEIIGIPDDRTYYNIDVEDFDSIIRKYEN